MRSIEDSSVLSKHLLNTLSRFKKYEEIIGPKKDSHHHFQEIHVIRGDDAYNITNVTTLSDNSLTAHAVNIKSGNRFRGMSGICIVFWSEEGYLWSRSIFFHKGMLFEEDIILDENSPHEPNS